MKEFHTYRLPNGIRCIHKQIRSEVAYCALIVNAGARDELADEYGLAHFTEHAIFKGTERRRAYQINCRLENLGGELNAYTTKEETAIHATVLRRDLAKAAELIADIAFRSTFPERELAKEREVVVDEINSYKDSPADMIYDSFEDMLFESSQLGHNILGRKVNLQRYDGDRIRRFISRTHTTDQMVFATMGGISDSRAEQIAHRYFAEQPESHRTFERIAPPQTERFEKSLNKQALSLLINTLGGPSANSLLNLAVRERNGLTYNIEASYVPFTDSGAAYIYFSSDRDRIDRCIELIDRQIDNIRKNSLSARQLSIAKKQYMGQLAISMENRESYMLSAGKSYLIYDDVESLDRIYEHIESISRSQIAEIAEDIFSHTSTLIYK